MSEFQPSEQPPAPLPISEWMVETLRLTAFPVTPAEVNLRSWWNDVFGEPPHSIAEEPRIGRSRISGPFRTGTALLQAQVPARIDWLLTMGGTGEEEVPSLGSYIPNRDAFREVITRWFHLPDCPVLNRFAFGAILTYPVADVETGYAQLQDYLPNVRLDPAHSEDFQYRINRPRDSAEMVGLRINRLSTWSVMYFQPVSMQIGPEGISQLTGTRSFACRLELDINTAPDENITVPPDALPSVFQELVTLANEIIREGDIP